MIFSLIIQDEEKSLFETAHITCIAMRSKSDYDAPLVAVTIARYINEGTLPVWLGYGGGKTIVYPDVELTDAILKPVSTRFPQFVQKGKDWLARYESLIEPARLENGRLESQFMGR